MSQGSTTKPALRGRLCRRRPEMIRLLTCGIASLAFGGSWAWPRSLCLADDPAATNRTAVRRIFDDQVRPILNRHCAECHGPEKPKKGFRVDRLGADLAGEQERRQWQLAVKRLRAGQMPPKSKPRPEPAEVEALLGWAQQMETAADARRAAEGRVVLRRLNRIEYENTIRDLLDINVDLKDRLPADSSADDFDNVGEALHVSSFLMERYLDAADTALGLAIASRPQPPLVKKRYRCQDNQQVKSSTERVYRIQDDALILFSSSHWNSVILWDFYPPDRGKYRFRISAAGVQSGGKPVTYRVDSGSMLMGEKNHLMGYYAAPADEPSVVEFVDHLEPTNTIRILPYALATAQVVDKIGAADYTGAGLAVQWIDVEGPLHETWPPESHRRIFGDQPMQPATSANGLPRLNVVSNDPLPDATRILGNFARRAFRRTVTDDDIRPLVSLVEARLADGQSFDQAIRVGLKAALVAPEFLFLRERPGRLDDFAMASRLSYFLWSTMPDDELLTLAEMGKLHDPAVLHAQVERLLASPKAAAFADNFVGQWLGLRDIDFTEPDRQLYPEYDELLRTAMVEETQRFFGEVLANNLSLTNFVASDFTYLNDRLARHYGIPGVEGIGFRKVPLPPGSHRGGLLTMASVLKVTANGTTTSPVVRGAWVLRRILGTPPAPPPAGVPAVEPDTRGTTTIREQLAKHRQIETCAACHTHIDPPGFALESFDVIGGYRENYRSVGNGEPVSIDGKQMPYAKGPKIDPADALSDGRAFANIDGLKELLLADKEQLARALTEKLLTYATGCGPRTADRPQIDTIVAKCREKNFGFRTLIHEIVQSESFQNK